jgi:hypothetical protein
LSRQLTTYVSESAVLGGSSASLVPVGLRDVSWLDPGRWIWVHCGGGDVVASRRKQEEDLMEVRWLVLRDGDRTRLGEMVGIDEQELELGNGDRRLEKALGERAGDWMMGGRTRWCFGSFSPCLNCAINHLKPKSVFRGKRSGEMNSRAYS